MNNISLGSKYFGFTLGRHSEGPRISTSYHRCFLASSGVSNGQRMNTGDGLLQLK
jgi:hypothetical protein